MKYLYIRKINKDGTISSTGGITVGYNVTKKDIVLSYTRCRYDDRFCRSEGRKEAERKMVSPDGPHAILPLVHPIQNQIVNEVCKQAKIQAKYDFPLVSINDLKFAAKHKRWISRFKPISANL